MKKKREKICKEVRDSINSAPISEYFTDSQMSEFIKEWLDEKCGQITITKDHEIICRLFDIECMTQSIDVNWGDELIETVLTFDKESRSDAARTAIFALQKLIERIADLNLISP